MTVFDMIGVVDMVIVVLVIQLVTNIIITTTSIIIMIMIPHRMTETTMTRQPLGNIFSQYM